MAIRRKESRRPLGGCNAFEGILIGIVFVYFAAPPQVLRLFGVRYLEDGPTLEKIHPATYALCFALAAAISFDGARRIQYLQATLRDRNLLYFLVATLVVGSYASVVHGASISPFIDTFVAACLVVVALSGMSRSSLTLFGILVDVFFISNIFLMVLERAMQSNFMPASNAQIRLSPTDALLGGVFRSHGWFTLPLDAAVLLGVYGICNVVLPKPAFDLRYVYRQILAIGAFGAMLLTGGRAATVLSISTLCLYCCYGVHSIIVTRRVRFESAIYAMFGSCVALVAGYVLYAAGGFDVVLSRFQNDIGSSLSREYAFHILSSQSWFGILVGTPLSDVLVLQRAYGLIAIEVAWVNFILVCGIVLSVALFIGWLFFLFGTLPKYCSKRVWPVSLFILIVTSTNNGIWAKTSMVVLSTCVVFGVSALTMAGSCAPGNVVARFRRQLFVPPRM